MDSVKKHHCSAPTVTVPHPPFLPLEGPWVANRILVVLVCLPSYIRLKNRNFVPLMERWEDHCMDYNHKLQFHRRLILVVWVCLQSLTRQDRYSMECNTIVQFQTFRILVVMVYQSTPSRYKPQNYAPRTESLVRHCTNCNRTIHFQTLLILVVVACLQSPSYRVSPGVLPRLEQ